MAEKKTAAKPARKEPAPTGRVLLMEFEVETKTLNPPIVEAIAAQKGIEDTSNLPETMTLLIPVGGGAGGPRAVIEKEARTPGTFRAIAEDSFGSGFEVVPPDPNQFELKPL